MCRTRSAKISAPPPGSESTPAAFIRSQRLRDRHLAPLRQERNLHHRERLDMHLGEALLQPAHQVHRSTQTADRDAARPQCGTPSPPRSAPCPPSAHASSSAIVYVPGRALLPPKRAQPATRHAHIRRIDVPVHVEVGDVPVHPLAHRVRHPPNGQDVAAAIQRDAIVEAQPLARLHLGRNRAQRRVAGLEAMPRPLAPCPASASPLLKKVNSSCPHSNRTHTAAFCISPDWRVSFLWPVHASPARPPSARPESPARKEIFSFIPLSSRIFSALYSKPIVRPAIATMRKGFNLHHSNYFQQSSADVDILNLLIRIYLFYLI